MQLITPQKVLTAGITGLALSKTVDVATILESLISNFTSAETALVGHATVESFAIYLTGRVHICSMRDSCVDQLLIRVYFLQLYRVHSPLGMIPQVAMERLISFANLKSEPPLKTLNDKHIIARATTSSTVKVTEPDTPREKTEQQQNDEQLLLGTEHTVPAELAPLIRDIGNGLGFKRQVHQMWLRLG